MDITDGYGPSGVGSIPARPANGVFSVVACIRVCETRGTRSILVRHPNAALADVVIAVV